MSLTHAQRTRLIRTTRKLATMLGDTPTVQISDPSTCRPAASSIRLARSSRSLSPPRINVTLPISSSSSSPTDSIPRSPLSPSSSSQNRDSIDDISFAKMLRRKRIAKLTHTFGQNVPPELVITDSGFPANQFLPETDAMSESSSFLDFETEVFDIKSEPAPSSSSESLLVAPFPPPGLKAPQLPLPLNLSSASAATARRNHRYAASVDDSKSPDKDLAFAKLMQHFDSSSMHSTFENTRQRQQSWSGEWNQGDMEEVQAKLRRLK
ncbi:hypothetical protein E1B28_005782 [Marasmius oreades]|uniref:Uncharacterized protein n=1 Tax=Marasmius oreades TaxID=181124 RepID=A0A9P7UV63_9AGAR|nr:uncharacterized protein E1B28_005782 [Marasmius oreades]KAG7094985.1 hypothetical protein E1B28_005782 [Marasmius oreades]